MYSVYYFSFHDFWQHLWDLADFFFRLLTAFALLLYVNLVFLIRKINLLEPSKIINYLCVIILCVELWFFLLNRRINLE